MSETYPSFEYNYAPSLALVSESKNDEPIDLFKRALDNPLTDFEPITLRDLNRIARHGHDETSTHLLTTLLLRSIGNDTSIDDYDKVFTAEAEAKKLSRSSRISAADKVLANKVALQAQLKAEPYTSMLGRVQNYQKAYKQTYENSTRHDIGLIIRDIYDRTEDIKHPVLMSLYENRQVYGAAGIESERLLRMMLAYARDSRPE